MIIENLDIPILIVKWAIILILTIYASAILFYEVRSDRKRKEKNNPKKGI